MAFPELKLQLKGAYGKQIRFYSATHVETEWFSFKVAGCILKGCFTQNTKLKLSAPLVSGRQIHLVLFYSSRIQRTIATFVTMARYNQNK